MRLPKPLAVALIVLTTVAVAAQTDRTAQTEVLEKRIAALSGEGRYAEAIPLAQQAVELQRTAQGETSAAFAKALDKLAQLCYGAGDYGQAETLFKRSLEIREKILGPDHLDVGASLSSLGVVYYAQGRYEEAEPLFKRCLALRERALGPDDPALNGALGNLGSLYYAQGRYSESEPMFKRSLALLEKALGPEAEAIVVPLSNLATLLMDEGKYAEAEPLFERSLAVREKVYGPEHPEVAFGLNALANLYATLGRGAEAEPLYERGLAIREKAFGPDHPDVANSLNNLAVLYSEQGRYKQAETYYRRSLAIWQKAYGPEHPEVATGFHNLAVQLYEEGQYGEAERLFEWAQVIREKILGPDHPAVAQTLNQLALLYDAQAKYAEEGALYERSLAILEKALGPDHPDVAYGLVNLANLDRHLGRDAEAEPLLKRALAILEKTLGPQHRFVATVLNNLGEVCAGQERYPEAEAYHRRSLAIREKALAPDHPDIAASLNNLGKLDLSRGQTAEAESLLERSLEILVKSVGPNGPNVATSLSNLALLCYRNGRPDRASGYYDRCLAVRLHELEDNYQYMTEKERLGFLRAVTLEVTGYFSFVLSAADRHPELAGKMYDVVLWEKGFVAQSVAALRAKILASGDPGAREELDQLAERKSDLAKLVSAPPPADPKQREDRRLKIESLAREAGSLERGLVARSSALGEEKRLARATWAHVRDALKPGEAAVEIVRFPFHNGVKWTEESDYVALILRRDSRRPELVPLGKGADLERVPLTDYRKLVTEVGAGGRPDAGRRFYEAFWRPIETKLGGARRVYISGDGEINQVALGVVPGKKGLPLAEAFDLRMLNSTKDMLRRGPAPPAATAVLLGAPDYELAEPQARAALGTGASGTRSSEVVDDARRRDGPGRRSALRGGTVDELLGTKQEVEDVSRVLEERGWRVRVYLGGAALEERVKEVVRPRVLHLATHGFFDPDQGTEPGSEDPMLRSGLYLAGANRALKGEASAPDLDDGILTAFEASQLDLEGTELVVLSACGTGLGRIEAGEGVFGLRRALQVAGAGAVLMSMWSVPDAETRELMDLFYARWLASGDKHRALREAQLEMRRRVRDRYGRDLPFYWGAFVLIGR